MKSHQRVAVLYVLLGAFWILCSNRLVAATGDNPQSSSWVQASKDWVILLGSVVVLMALTRPVKQVESLADDERKAIFNETVQGVYHVVFNYMNNMQMVLMEAERCDDFSRETLELARTSATATAEDLRKLQQLKEITQEQIHAVFYAKMEVGKEPRADVRAEAGHETYAAQALPSHARPWDMVAS